MGMLVTTPPFQIATSSVTNAQVDPSNQELVLQTVNISVYPGTRTTTAGCTSTVTPRRRIVNLSRRWQYQSKTNLASLCKSEKKKATEMRETAPHALCTVESILSIL